MTTFSWPKGWSLKRGTHILTVDYMALLQLRVSFSLDGHVHSVKEHKGSSITSDVVDFFLNSVGATFTEIKEVELR